MPDPRVLTINTNELEPFECSNMLLAAMAFSGPSQLEERRQAYDALCASNLYEAQRLDGDASAFLNPRLNSYLEVQTSKEAIRMSKKVKRILGRRSEIGNVAEPWIGALVGNGVSEPLAPLTEAALIQRFDQLSVEAIKQKAAAVAELADKPGPVVVKERDAQMWVRRVWRPAIPAFPLFAAYHTVANRLEPEYIDPFDNRSAPWRAPDGLTTPIVAKLAMRIQERLCEDPIYRFKSEDLIWLDWTDADCDEPLKSALGS